MDTNCRSNEDRCRSNEDRCRSNEDRCRSNEDRCRSNEGRFNECCICCEPFTVGCDIVIIKHDNDAGMDVSRKRGHYFHRHCLTAWRVEQDACPLDRDAIARIYTVPGYHVVGLDLGNYDHDYYRLLTDVKVRVTDKMLDQFADVDDVDKNNKTIAFYACKIGNHTLVSKLLTRGANFNRPCGERGFTPLMVAVCYNHHQIVSKILSGGKQAGTNCYDADGVTAFGYACRYSHSRIIGEFLDRKLVTCTEVRCNLDLYKARYRADKLYGEEILGRIYHYLSWAK